MDNIPAVDVSSFYHTSPSIQRKRPVENSMEPSNTFTPYKMRRLLDGPPITWKVFNKQADALQFASVHKYQVMTFAFETSVRRFFLVAHPEVFWFHDCKKSPELRSTYEIIPENTACKLYFDIEFNKPLNPSRNGHKMLIDFIAIVTFFLNKKFKIQSSIEDVLILDSSTDAKFSSHLIFNIRNTCFRDNRQAGNFVNFICSQIMLIIDTKELPGGLEGISVDDCAALLVQNQKNNLVLFCDQSVYSQNRHFRLYMSSKLGKGIPLVISPINKYKPQKEQNYEQEIFFASLITYLPENFEKMRVLNFDYNGKHKVKPEGDCNINLDKSRNSDPLPSPFKEIDDFINDIVKPGKIFRSCYFSSSNVINYDIVGNRFCGNIGRQHKSNNVKYIVDLNDGVYYQKCHDFDCRDYKSEKKPLPENLQEVKNTGENCKVGSFDVTQKSPQKSSFQRFPSCGLSDEDMLDCLNKSGDFQN